MSDRINTTTQSNLARSRLYQLLSRALFFPDEQLFNEIKNGNLTREINELTSKLGIKQVRLEVKSDSLEKLQREYTSIFGHIVSGECPQYETYYGSTNIHQQSQELADISGFYRAFGLKLSPDTREKLDHISVELEFMSFLCCKEAYALEQNQIENAQICRDAQSKFLKDHITRWVPHFTGKIHANGTPYKYFVDLLRNFIDHECKSFGIKPEVYREIDLKPVSGPETSCDSCFFSEGELP